MRLLYLHFGGGSGIRFDHLVRTGHSVTIKAPLFDCSSYLFQFHWHYLKLANMQFQTCPRCLPAHMLPSFRFMSCSQYDQWQSSFIRNCEVQSNVSQVTSHGWVFEQKFEEMHTVKLPQPHQMDTNDMKPPSSK